MSIQALCLAWQQKIACPGQKFTLVALSNYADEDGYCYPGQATLVADTAISERSIRTHLKALEEAGFITRQPRHRSNGSRTSDGYQLSLTPPATIAGRTDDQPATVAEPTGNGCPPTTLNRQKNHQLVEEGIKNPSDSLENRPKTRPCQAMVEIYREHCPSLSPVTEITAARRKIALARLDDLGGLLTSWEAFCDHVENSDFLAGRKTDFVAGFDWILKKANFIKIMEGRYANREGQGKHDDKAAYKAYEAAVGRLQERLGDPS